MGMALVPPRGYQTPPAVCMCAIPHNTAGEASGDEPTYCVKWSSIWATRGSGINDRTVRLTVEPMRMDSTSPSVLMENEFFRSNTSGNPPTDRQKKNLLEMS